MGRLKITAEPGQLSIVSQASFDAPTDKVFKAYTDVDLVKKWWGGRTYETVIDKFEPRAGGSWRMVQKDANGQYAFHGVFHEVAEADKRIIWTFEFEGLPEAGHVALETIYFTEKDDKTEVRTVSVFQSIEDRDGMIASGMETGANESIEALADLVEENNQ